MIENATQGGQFFLRDRSELSPRARLYSPANFSAEAKALVGDLPEEAADAIAKFISLRVELNRKLRRAEEIIATHADNDPLAERVKQAAVNHCEWVGSEVQNVLSAWMPEQKYWGH